MTVLFTDNGLVAADAERSRGTSIRKLSLDQGRAQDADATAALWSGFWFKSGRHRRITVELHSGEACNFQSIYPWRRISQEADAWHRFLLLWGE